MAKQWQYPDKSAMSGSGSFGVYVSILRVSFENELQNNSTSNRRMNDGEKKKCEIEKVKSSGKRFNDFSSIGRVGDW